MTTEIIYGDSTFGSMSKSKLNKNEIIKFDTIFSIADLSNIENYEIYLPKKIYLENIIYNFKSRIDELNKSIKNKNKIRIWSSHKEINSYLLLLYLCNYLKDYKCDIFVVYSNEYDEECYSPSCMLCEELEKLSHLEHKLTKEEILSFSNEWVNIRNINSEMRILENNKVKSVSYDYFYDEILEKLKKLGAVKQIHLIGQLVADNHMIDTIFVYLINRLIRLNKIDIVEKDEDNTLNNIIIKAN